MFGLSKEITKKINELLEENVTDIVEVDTENGEHITITVA